MNIFVLSKDPKLAAKYHCDKHVVKMTLETAQIMSTVVRELGFVKFSTGLKVYQSTHKNHPCVLWAQQSYENFMWLGELGAALANEFHYRYNKTHKSQDVIIQCAFIGIFEMDNFPIKGMTEFVQAMPAQYRNLNPVRAYRDYYIHEKSNLLTYTKREKPLWIDRLPV